VEDESVLATVFKDSFPGECSLTHKRSQSVSTFVSALFRLLRSLTVDDL